MIEVSIENKEGKVLFSCKGESIDSTYNKEYAGGDRIVIIKKSD